MILQCARSARSVVELTPILAAHPQQQVMCFAIGPMYELVGVKGPVAERRLALASFLDASTVQIQANNCVVITSCRFLFFFVFASLVADDVFASSSDLWNQHQ